MSSFGATLFIPGIIDNVAGLISLVGASFIDFLPSPSGGGELLSVEFVALAPGVSPLAFANVFLNLSDLGFTHGHGQVTVTGDPNPDRAAGASGLLRGSALGFDKVATARGVKPRRVVILLRRR